MEQTTEISENGVMRSSADGGGGVVPASRWTNAWTAGQPVTSQLIAECPVCLSDVWPALIALQF